MKARRLSEVAAITGGTLIGDDATARAAVIDSRDAGPGSLFFALGGEHHDGHTFAGTALEAGAAGAVVSDVAAVGEPFGRTGPLVVVGDVTRALQALAAHERRDSDVPVVAITGSTGKTTTKDLVHAVLATRLRVQAAPGSFNNELGVPLTLLGASEDTEVIITEMGARGIGHIAELTEIAQPDVGIVTNVGVAHMELFGSQEAIAQAKGELVESLSTSGHAVLNQDDPVVRDYASRTKARIWRVGVASEADVRAVDVELDPAGLARFTIEAQGARAAVALATPGAHLVTNALAAAATGLALGVELDDIARGLAGAQMSAWRMETSTNSQGVVVINDAYNANPTSMEAALKAARWIARDSRLCAVLGTMRELGSISFAEHERVGELTARLRVERVIAVGDEAKPIADAALREGAEPDQVAWYATPADALPDVQRWAEPGDVVLCKGSRAVGLEQIAEALR